MTDILSIWTMVSWLLIVYLLVQLHNVSKKVDAMYGATKLLYHTPTECHPVLDHVEEKVQELEDKQERWGWSGQLDIVPGAEITDEP